MLRLAVVLVSLLAGVITVPAQQPVGGRVVADADFSDQLTPEQNARLAARFKANVAELARRGAFAPSAAVAGVADLQWPLQPVPGYDQPDYHGTKFFVDHDSRFPGFVQDYTCGTRTYDLASGYNHAGTDYYLWPFAWLMMDQGVVRIVAAAPGVIADKDDGNFDRDCAIASATDPNFVSVRQDDGLTAIYLHMRSGSVTTLPIGTRIGAGDYLGLVGSSGQSSGPHLHFELRDANGFVVDPRHGQCNAAPDRWAVLQPYEDPHIDTLTTHSAEPDQIACGYAAGTNLDDTPNYKNVFAPGDTLWVFASYRDQRNGEVTHFEILRPDASVFAQWDFDLAGQNLPNPFYSGTSWDWQHALPSDAPAGVWSVTAHFAGQEYVHPFTVTGASARDAADTDAAREQAGTAASRCRSAASCPP